jgi:hypothetical protein
MPGTFRYTVYIGNGVGSDWFSVNVTPANRVDAALGRWEGQEKSGSSVLLSGKTTVESEVTTMHRKGRLKEKTKK